MILPLHKCQCLCAGVRCVQQRCVVPLPMPVPLPFPHVFGPAVARYGDTLRHSQVVSQQQPSHHPQQPHQQHPQQQPQRSEANGRAAGGEALDAVVSVPELTRLAADAQFREVLRLQRRQLASAAGTPSIAPPPTQHVTFS